MQVTSIMEALSLGVSTRRQSQDRLALLRDTAAVLQQGTNRQSPKAQELARFAYNTRLKQDLMTGSQAASVYYGPAARNPLKPPPKGSAAKISMKGPSKLQSEKFVQQKATKMDSP